MRGLHRQLLRLQPHHRVCTLRCPSQSMRPMVEFAPLSSIEEGVIARRRCYSERTATTSPSSMHQHTDDVNSSIMEIKPKAIAHAPQQPSAPAGNKIPQLTQRLLSKYPSHNFEQILTDTRQNKSLLRQLQLSHEEASNMFILPPDLLRDVHSAIMNFSKKSNFHGMVLRLSSQGEVTSLSPNVSPFAKLHNQKIPGPILCTRLLELIGIPQYCGGVAEVVVHSSQIDSLLECCVETTVALSRSCETGKYSLIGTNFNSQYTLNASNGETKSAAQLAEDIFRSVSNMQIKYTSGKREYSLATTQQQQPQQMIRVGRIGSIPIGHSNPVVEYLNYEAESMAPTMGEANVIPWSPKDQRRYDTAVILFNSVLATYAKLSSSSSGMRQEARRASCSDCERLLLEMASKKACEPSPSTIIQCIKPDAISFNTAIKAWSEFSPKEARGYKGSGRDADSSNVAFATAERTESILKMMQDLWDEERKDRTTFQSVQAAWGEYGNDAQDLYAPPPKGKAIAPNTLSYNAVIKAWSRSSNPEAAVRALKVYETMISRINVARLSRDSLMLQHSEQVEGKKSHDEVGDSFPDSRTFVSLLQSLHNLSLAIGFQDAVATVESIYQSAKQWDEQMRWSVENGIATVSRPLLNIHSYNTLIKTLSNLPTNWDESYQCCLRVDDIVREMKSTSLRDILCLPNAITAWAKCAEYAGEDKERAKICAEKADAYLDHLLAEPVTQRKGGLPSSDPRGRYLINAINDTIALYGRAGLPLKADEFFLRAKECNAHNLSTLSTTIDTLCGSKDIAYVDKAYQYLLDFEQEKMRLSTLFVVPDMKYTRMYNSVIDGYLNCNNKKSRGLKCAQGVLAHMISSHESNPRHIARPNTTSFARVMSVLAQKGDNTGELEALLSKMDAMHQRRANVNLKPDADLLANVKPNIVIYNLLLKAYARSNTDESLQSAMKIIGRIEKDPSISPDEVSNAYILELLSRNGAANGSGIISSGGDGKLGSPDLTKLDIGGLNLNDLNLDGRQIVEPTSKSFNSIMNVYASSGTTEAAEKATALLRKLEAMHISGEIRFRPDIILYNKAMNAWESCGEPEKAQEILDFICERCEAGEGDISPNDVSFSICIHSWCKSSQDDAPERAEQLLRRKEVFAKKFGFAIKSTDYNACISRWKDDPVKGPKRATLLFEEMLQRYGDSSEKRTKPSEGTLNALLDVFAKSNQRNWAEKAENYLHRMNQLHKESGGCIRPDVISYRTAIDAWIRAWDKDSPKKVDALVRDMIDKYKNEDRSDLCPDSNLLNLVLKACQTAPAMWKESDSAEKGNDHPIAIANHIFYMLKENKFGAKATHATYAFLFLTYRQHMDFHDKRYSPLMEKLWRQCIRDGLVSQFSLSAFRDSVLEHEFWKAVGGKDKYEKTKADKISVKDFPKEWNRNVAPDPKKKLKQQE